MFELLSLSKRIINVDESWVPETNYNRSMWCPINAPYTITDKFMSPRLALIATLDTDGNVYFSLTHSNTDNNVMLLFILGLVNKLNQETPDWISKSVLLLDNAKYHTSEETRAGLKKLQVPVIYSGPYSYSSAPIELLFAGLKTN